MSILDKLKASRTVVRTFMLGDIEMGLRILTERDYQDAGWAANDLLTRHETELKTSNADLFESEKATQLIQRFLIDPVSRKPVFESAEQVLALLSREERAYIGEQYFDFEKEHSQSERTMSDADFLVLLDDVKKKPDPTLLSDSSGALLRRLAITLAAELQSLQKDSGSSSSP